MSTTHWIYPLSLNGRYVFAGAAGTSEPLPITPLNFWSFAEKGTTDRWGLHIGFRIMEPGDLVWAYFTDPVKQIVGIGTALQVEWEPNFGRHAVDIRWDASLTKRMRIEPITYAQYGQHVQSPAIRANETTRRVFERWLTAHNKTQAIPSPEVRFAARQVQQRLGQRDFRNAALDAFSSVCAFTGCQEPSVLQAAHIVPVARGGRHDIANSLLLRADLHNLFDLGKIYVKADMTVAIDPSVHDPTYTDLGGRTVSRPRGVTKRAFARQLAMHRAMHSH